MSNGLEIRWHGRGGQGAKTAALLLADVAFKTGAYVQGFPEYGPERMGAPITAYNRISRNEIRVHSNIYTPDLVVVVDESLLESMDNFTYDMATLIGLSLEVDQSSFEVIEKEKEDKTGEEEKPFESPKKETKKRGGIFGSLKGRLSNIEQTLFTGNNDENNDW